MRVVCLPWLPSPVSAQRWTTIGLSVVAGVDSVECVAIQGCHQDCIEEPANPQGLVLDRAVASAKRQQEERDQKRMDPEADDANTRVGRSDQGSSSNTNDQAGRIAVEEVLRAAGLGSLLQVEAHEPCVVDGQEVQDADDHVRDAAYTVEVEEPSLLVLIVVLPRKVENVRTFETNSEQGGEEN